MTLASAESRCEEISSSICSFYQVQENDYHKKSNYSSEISTTNNTTTNVDHPAVTSNSASNSSSTSYSWKRLFKCCDSSPSKRHQNNHITEVSKCRRVTVTGVCPLKQLLDTLSFISFGTPKLGCMIYEHKCT